ncbi:MAG: hypothetical protein KDE26_17230 [Bacteroidetes bacterium]|nr:hypothetical protein [Bacteroidota bacterium]
MKHLPIIIFFFLIKTSFAQQINPNLITLNGLPFFSTQSQILEKMGPPAKIFEPKYECGFLSEEEQGRKFFTLKYPGLPFTGNETDKYLIEEIDFSANSEIQLMYNGQAIFANMTIEKLSAVFGVDFEPNSVEKLIYFERADDGFVFQFKDGKLIKISYWSPC